MLGSVEKLEQSLKWLKMDFDEGPTIGGMYGPYVQSERLHLYRTTVSTLVREGGAYPCFCSRKRLASLRERGIWGGYDGFCRELSGRQAEEKIRLGLPHTMRMKVSTTRMRWLDDLEMMSFSPLKSMYMTGLTSNLPSILALESV